MAEADRSPPPAGQASDTDRVKLALEAGRLGTWRWVIATGELSWDEPLERVFGLTPGAFAGTFDAYLSLLHPDDRAATVTAIERSLATGDPHYVEHRVVGTDGSIRWISGTGRIEVDDTGAAVAVIGVGADITTRKVAEERLQFLVRAGELLGSSLDLDTTLQQLCDLAVERLGDWCSVDLLEPGGVRLVAVSHRDSDKVAYARRLRERFGVNLDDDQGLPKVLRTGLPEVLPEIDEQFIRTALAELGDLTTDEIEQFVALGIRSSMVVPLTGAGGVVLGALSLVSAESGRRYGEQDVALATEVARRAGTAVENATLYAQVEHAARTLQHSLLPPTLPELDFAGLAAYYAPLGIADLIGGDFYDAFPISDGRRWCLVIGDVSGKGVDAAALTAAVRWTLRSALARGTLPGAAIGELNRALLEQDWGGRFVTVCAVLLQPHDNGVSVRYACGGHPPPIVIRNDGTVQSLASDGQIVGVLPAPAPATQQAELSPGEALVLYSDGFTEARRDGELFGETGMLSALHGLTPDVSGQQIVDRLTAAVASFGRQSDDMALLACKLHSRAQPQARSASSQGGVLTTETGPT